MTALNLNEGWYSPGCSYDPLKHKNIVWTFLDELNYHETARIHRVSEHCVRDCVSHFLNRRSYSSLRKGHRVAKCDDSVAIMLLVLVRLYPKYYLDEYQLLLIFYLNLQQDEVPSISAISRKLKECGISDKALSVIYAERFSPANLINRYAFVQWRTLYELHRFYFLDETGICVRDGNRSHGWSLLGERINDAQPTRNSRKRWNVIAMVGFTEGVVNAFPVNVHVNWTVFRAVFMTAFLDFIPPGSFICMDNASIHNYNDLVTICAPRNVTVVMIPPYSPDFSPIENVFGVVKSNLRRTVGQNLQNPPAEIMTAFQQVRPAVVRSFYLKAWMTVFNR